MEIWCVAAFRNGVKISINVEKDFSPIKFIFTLFISAFLFNVANIILKDKNMVNLHIQGLGSFLNHLDDFI